jgi:anti-sigma B factor antagonist
VPSGYFYIGEEPPTDTEQALGVAVLAASGELDVGAVPVLKHLLEEHIGSDRAHLVVDMTETTFIDSTAIGALVDTAMRLRAYNRGSLEIVCAQPYSRVQRIFDIAGVADIIPLHSSRASALVAIDAARREAGEDGDEHIDTFA